MRVFNNPAAAETGHLIAPEKQVTIKDTPFDPSQPELLPQDSLLSSPSINIKPVPPNGR